MGHEIKRTTKYEDTLDFIPTPPWATRALFETMPYKQEFVGTNVLDPCAGAGHMTDVLKEYGANVTTCDIKEYGYALDFKGDYLKIPTSPDWTIMNPPFKHAQKFIEKALRESLIGVCAHVKLQFLESKARYELFTKNPPFFIAQFSKRVPTSHGRVVEKGSGMMSHLWIVWDHRRGPDDATEFIWIDPDTQTKLQRWEDYLERTCDG